MADIGMTYKLSLEKGTSIEVAESTSPVRICRNLEAYVSGANFSSWSLIGLPRKPSYSVSFLHRIFLLSSPHTIILDISD